MYSLLKEDMRFIGMMKLHTDCLIGRPGLGRSAAVSKRTPLQMARNAPEFLAVRVTITGSEPSAGVSSPKHPSTRYPSTIFTLDDDLGELLTSLPSATSSSLEPSSVSTTVFPFPPLSENDEHVSPSSPSSSSTSALVVGTPPASSRYQGVKTTTYFTSAGTRYSRPSLATPTTPTTPAPVAIYTFFVSRNTASYAEIERMKSSTQGSLPVSVAYDVVANKHLATTKTEVPEGIMDVLDVSGNFTSARDKIHTNGSSVTAVLTRIDGGNRIELRLNFSWQRAARTLSIRGGCLFYEVHVEN